MASLLPPWNTASPIQQKAFEDAEKMQKAVVEACVKTGKEIPKYRLSELIGKGSFGRVYKATSQKTGQLVAVKIIDIEESDTADPKLADTYSDLLKEINALQLLNESGAKNINHVIEALPVGQSMWVITEYCAGGSVATLMRPTAPGGLPEKWIIPIVREVAEALRWVHGQGIIHRDIKCANVLVTDAGDVQLCDFGVSGVIQTKFDKRTTCIGTPHWMAPELFDQSTLYGTEVDIWAFGALVYEVASGLPPNVAERIDFSRLPSRLKQHTPRLEGDCYSNGLKDLVAYCLQHDASKRPTIEEIQRHGYIYNTEEYFPAASLSHLVRAYKLWEAQGGHRQSLFSVGGAQGLANSSSTAMNNNGDDDDWDFNTTAAFDQQILAAEDVRDVYQAYGQDIEFSHEAFEDTSKPVKGKSRRRPPPNFPSVKAPLEKIFDPNTISSYEDNSRSYYGRFFPAPVSDLPLRDESAASADVRESLIDLDVSLHGSDLSQFVDLGTMRAGGSHVGGSRESIEIDMGDMGETSSYNNPFSSDYPDVSRNSYSTSNINDNRRTQDWKFPAPVPPAPMNPQEFTFPPRPSVATATASSSKRPSLVHHQTEPYQTSRAFDELVPSSSGSEDLRASVFSLIDLDMSFADPAGADTTRPTTSHSDVGSFNESEAGTAYPFELEKHTSLNYIPTSIREPSIYVSDESEYSTALAALPDVSNISNAPNMPNMSNVSSISNVPNMSNMPSDNEYTSQKDSSTTTVTRTLKETEQTAIRPYSLSEFADMDPEDITPQPPTAHNIKFPSPYQDYPHSQPTPPEFNSPAQSPAEPDQHQEDHQENLLPALPDAPSPRVMQGQASADEVKEELRRLAMSLGDHLSYANAYMSSLTIRRASVTRLEAVGDLI